MRVDELNRLEQPEYNSLKTAFDRYYTGTLYPFLKEKENIRVKYVTRFVFLVLLAAVFLPMLAVGIYFFNHYYQKDIDWGIFYIFVAIGIYVIRGPYKNYRKSVKNDVMTLFLKFFPDFQYEGGNGLSLYDFQKSRIFPAYTTAKADDCFRGVYQGVGIRVCEELLENEYHDAKGRRHVRKVFQGIGVELEMNKPFSGQTIVVKDRGIFNALVKYDGLQRVKLEDVVFEKIFEVYSNDQIEARYLLTTAFMERILSLQELYKGKKIQVSFYDNKMMISVDTHQDMFEPCSFFKTNLNKAKFDTVFEQIWTIFSIIHLLKLDRKIGL